MPAEGIPTLPESSRWRTKASDVMMHLLTLSPLFVSLTICLFWSLPPARRKWISLRWGKDVCFRLLSAECLGMVIPVGIQYAGWSLLGFAQNLKKCALEWNGWHDLARLRSCLTESVWWLRKWFDLADIDFFFLVWHFFCLFLRQEMIEKSEWVWELWESQVCPKPRRVDWYLKIVKGPVFKI